MNYFFMHVKVWLEDIENIFNSGMAKVFSLNDKFTNAIFNFFGYKSSCE